MKPYVTEEQIRAAKAVNTLAFLLRHQPEQFKRVGRTEYAHCDHDSLKVSSNGKWNWHSRGVGGTTAVQYLIKVEGYDFVRAVQIVCADAPFLSSPPVIGEKNSGFALPLRGDSFKAYQYLAGRGICDEVLAFCFHTGRVYGTNRRTAEREYTNCALPGFVDSKNEEKTERNAGYLVVSHSGGGMLRQGTRKGIRRTPANRGMRAHWVVKGLDISEDVCHGMCP